MNAACLVLYVKDKRCEMTFRPNEALLRVWDESPEFDQILFVWDREIENKRVLVSNNYRKFDIGSFKNKVFKADYDGLVKVFEYLIDSVLCKEW